MNKHKRYENEIALYQTQKVDRKKFEKFTGLVKKKMGSSAKDADAQTALIDLKRGYEDICEIKLN